MDHTQLSLVNHTQLSLMNHTHTLSSLLTSRKSFTTSLVMLAPIVLNHISVNVMYTVIFQEDGYTTGVEGR